MKTIKSALLIIVSLFSLSVLASEWSHQQVSSEVHLSFTQRWLPPTYGSNGGAVAGLFYIDVRTEGPSLVRSARIFKKGRLISNVQMIEDHESHFYGRQENIVSYADFLYFGQKYTLEIDINGQMNEIEFTL